MNYKLCRTKTTSLVQTKAEKLSLVLIVQDVTKAPTQEVVYIIGAAL